VALVDRTLALDPGSGLEVRARRARRRALVAMAEQVGATRIALGHTADDQAETVLLRLLRGAGRGALGGMRTARGRLLRPLLASTRADVRHFLADRRVAFAVDRSNADLHHARNRMRRLVLPMLAAEFNPRVGPALAALAARLHEEDDLLEALAAERRGALVEDGRLGVAVADEPAALGRRIVRTWLEAGARAGVTAEHVERVLALARGVGRGTVGLPGAARVLREGSHLVRHGTQRPAAAFCLSIVPGGSAADPGTGWRLWLSPPRPCAEDDARGGDPSRVAFDAEALGESLLVRSRRAGDRIHLQGIGTRKLQDVLVDAKVPRERRSGVPLLESAGQILWVAGVVRGSGATVGQRTRQVVEGVFERAGGTVHCP
jgi:tRNA(Ile)-lysidine synthase